MFEKDVWIESRTYRGVAHHGVSRKGLVWLVGHALSGGQPASHAAEQAMSQAAVQAGCAVPGPHFPAGHCQTPRTSTGRGHGFMRYPSPYGTHLPPAGCLKIM